jgi:uncharacterized membrane protein YcaP (DUF421 family)
VTHGQAGLPAVIIAAIVVGAQRFIAGRAWGNKRIEHATQGNVSILVMDGQLELEVIKHCQLSREQIFAQLRSAGCTNLGMVRRMYMEAGGSFSILRFASPQPGLSLIPFCDPEFRSEQSLSKGSVACAGCGCVGAAESSTHHPCSRCHGRLWTAALAQ